MRRGLGQSTPMGHRDAKQKSSNSAASPASTTGLGARLLCRREEPHPGTDDNAWVPIEYTCDGYAEVADCCYTTGKTKNAVTRHLVVRRTRLADTGQQKLFPDWRHHAFLTDSTGPAIEVDAFHRHHLYSYFNFAAQPKPSTTSSDQPPTGPKHSPKHRGGASRLRTGPGWGP